MSAPENQNVPLNTTSFKSIEALVVEAGVRPSLFMESLATVLSRLPDPVRAINNFERFLHTGFATSIIRDFASQRILLEIALELFSQSQFLADILVRDPELFRWLTTSSALTSTKARSQYVREAKQATELFQRTERKLDSLKRYHRRELLRLGAKEVLEEGNIRERMAELSWLADAILEAVLEIALHQMALRTGVRFEPHCAIIGLGKLGGEELNFSSDIDLLFVYDQDGELEIPSERIHSFHELYVRIGEMMVRMLTERTEEGHLYRVDMRLRPDGSGGPLALSRAGYRTYYETRGELWERQMLTKARVVAGNRMVGERWMEDIRPFVYPRTLLQSPMAEIYSMKRRIEEKVQDRDNIKLGSGGIRDIEFIVQALQLLSGGTEPGVREHNTLRALDALRDHAKIASDEHAALAEAYLFLRRVEHRLQLLHGLQTHSLPEDAEELEQLSRRLGFTTKNDFRRDLERHRMAVRKVFTSFFAPRRGLKLPKALPAQEPGYGQLKAILLELGLDDAQLMEIERIVTSIGDTRSVAHKLQQLLQQGPNRTLAEALRNRKMAELLMLVCARSSVLVERLAREPLLVESFVGQTEQMMRRGPQWEFLKGTDLHRYREYNEFKLCLRFLAGRCNVLQFRKELSALAEEIVVELFSLASLKVSQNVALPRMSLVALGRLGSQGMNLGSDVDLLLLYDDLNPEAGPVAERILKEMIRLNDTPRGKVYEFDFRLRPEGRNAPLAVGLGYFTLYHEARGELWERQMLTRARIIAGDASMNRVARRLLHRIAYEHPLPKNWGRATLAMRLRMERERGGDAPGSINLKLDSGGIADIEFLVQALRLCFGNSAHELCRGDEHQVLKTAARLELLASEMVWQLLENDKYLHTLETFNRLQGGASLLHLQPDVLELYAKALREASAHALLQKLRAIQQENRTILVRSLRIWEKQNA